MGLTFTGRIHRSIYIIEIWQTLILNDKMKFEVSILTLAEQT